MSGRGRTVVVVILLACISAAQRGGGGQIPWVVSEVQRDYAGNTDATDRTWFYLDAFGQAEPAGGGQYPSVEFVYGRGYDAPAVVAPISQTVNLAVTFDNQHSLGVSGTFTLNAVRIIPPSPHSPITLSASASNTRLSMAAYGGTDVVDITFTVPSYITMGQIELDYDLTLTDGVVPSTASPRVSGEEQIFVPFDGPLGLQSVPWTDLLAYSCGWAYGDSTSLTVVSDCTDGLFADSPFSYNSATPNFYTPAYSTYDLKGALDLTFSEMDCQDVSGFLHLALSGQGISSSLERAEDFNYGPFHTNPLCPMGADPTYAPYYMASSFNFHKFVIYFFLVYDASNAQYYDLTGSVFKQPPKAWLDAGYYQTSNGLGGFYGLVDRPVGFSSSFNSNPLFQSASLSGVF